MQWWLLFHIFSACLCFFVLMSNRNPHGILIFFVLRENPIRDSSSRAETHIFWPCTPHLTFMPLYSSFRGITSIFSPLRCKTNDSLVTSCGQGPRGFLPLNISSTASKVPKISSTCTGSLPPSTLWLFPSRDYFSFRHPTGPRRDFWDDYNAVLFRFYTLSGWASPEGFV